MKAIEINQLSVYYEQVLALKDISLSIEEGEYVGIVGPNGGGKSTFMKALLGFVPIHSGSIKIFGQKPSNYKGQIGYVPQFSKVDRNFPITVEEVVCMGTMKSGVTPFFQYSAKNRELAGQQLAQVGMEHRRKRQIGDLSGGEFQKMLIARALTVQPDLLLLDEPTSSLDVQSRDEIYEILNRLKGQMTILMITHDLDTNLPQLDSVIAFNTTLRDQGLYGNSRLGKKGDSTHVADDFRL